MVALESGPARKQMMFISYNAREMYMLICKLNKCLPYGENLTIALEIVLKER